MRCLLLIVVFALSLSGPARADDFDAACKLVYGSQPAMDWMCKCLSGHVPGPKRAAAITSLKLIAEAISSHTAIDPAEMTIQGQEGMAALNDAHSQCQP